MGPPTGGQPETEQDYYIGWVLWALLAAFLTRQPPAVQASVVGLCTGLFIATSADANQRTIALGSTLALVLVAGVVSGGLFYVGLLAQARRWRPRLAAAPRWVAATYAAVWIFGLVAAVRALFGAGGFTVAVLAIVPLVLLAPAAIGGARTILGRPAAPDTDRDADRAEQGGG